MKYYDPENNRIICVEEDASCSFWDSHWKIDSSIRNKILRRKSTFVSKNTQVYLRPEDGAILEGGCGKGKNVASLVNNGYRCIGIDYAAETTGLVKKYVPELDIRQGDVRDLPFAEDSFAGYWSLGVIEHYWEGYESIASEMFRVIRNDGYLFLAFPYMSPLRRFKVKSGLYDLWKGSRPEKFYQFILDSKSVVEDFQKIGFSLIKTVPYDAKKRTKDEISFLKPFLQRLYDYEGRLAWIYLLRTQLSKLFQPVASHCILLILKKQSN